MEIINLTNLTILALLVLSMFSFLVGAYANTKGYSWFGFFLISLIFSPLIGLLIALIVSPNEKYLEKKALDEGYKKKCPYCAELIKPEAIVCRFCGRDYPETENYTLNRDDDIQKHKFK